VARIGRPRATVAADGSFRPQFYEDAGGIPAGPVARVTVAAGETVVPPIRLP
jgi:hypothetical protein